MGIICSPSLFSADMLTLQDELDSIKMSGAQWVHLDIMDGLFVPNFFLSPKTIKDIRRGTSLFLDAHLMISNPDKYIQIFAESGCDAITFHQETTTNSKMTIEKIHRMDKQAGISLSPKTPVDAIVPMLSSVDIVLVMAINPGIPNQTFMMKTLEKVAYLNSMKTKQKLSFRISVDGGVTLEHSLALQKAGANVLVTGSSFFSSDNRKNFVDALIL